MVLDRYSRPTPVYEAAGATRPLRISAPVVNARTSRIVRRFELAGLFGIAVLATSAFVYVASWLLGSWQLY